MRLISGMYTHPSGAGPLSPRDVQPWIPAAVVGGIPLGHDLDRIAPELVLTVPGAGAEDRGVRLTVPVDVIIEQLPDVIDDDVEDDLDVVLVQRVDHLAELGEVAEVRVDVLEVLGPVAVVARDPRVLLDVDDDRAHPHRRDAERLQVVDAVDHALVVAPHVPGERRRVSGDVVVVVHVAVGEPIDEQLVDDLVAPVLDVGRRDGGLRVGGRVDAAGEGEEQVGTHGEPPSRSVPHGRLTGTPPGRGRRTPRRGA
jgi:hypothetical protein